MVISLRPLIIDVNVRIFWAFNDLFELFLSQGGLVTQYTTSMIC